MIFFEPVWVLCKFVMDCSMHVHLVRYIQSLFIFDTDQVSQIYNYGLTVESLALQLVSLNQIAYEL